MSKFNVGDDVFDLFFGFGSIEKISLDVYPVIACFESRKESYTAEGRLHYKYKYPSLFTAEEAAIKFPEYPRPKKMKKVKGWIAVGSTEFNKGTYNTSYFSTDKTQLNGWPDSEIYELEIEVEE